MSCWVVPSIAAELWGVSVEHVLASIREGRIPSRIDNGFVCVDAAPGSPRLKRSNDEHPPTFTVVTEDEMAALLGGNADDDIIDEDQDEPESKDDDDDEPAEVGTLDWRDARRRNASMRRAPVGAA